jgi:hypothetical protein
MNTILVSGGRNPNNEICCGFPPCIFWKRDRDKFFGWCLNRENRVVTAKNPNGFSPSVGGDGYCNHHTIDLRHASEATNHLPAWPSAGFLIPGGQQ